MRTWIPVTALLATTLLLSNVVCAADVTVSETTKAPRVEAAGENSLEAGIKQVAQRVCEWAQKLCQTRSNADRAALVPKIQFMPMLTGFDSGLTWQPPLAAPEKKAEDKSAAPSTDLNMLFSRWSLPASVWTTPSNNASVNKENSNNSDFASNRSAARTAKEQTN